MTLPKPATAAIPDRVRFAGLLPAVALSGRQDVTGQLMLPFPLLVVTTHRKEPR